MSNNRYQLNDSVRKKYIPIIKKHIDNIANCNLEDKSRNEIALDLSDTELNPYTIGIILESDFGYEEEDTNMNGWEMDFWIYYTKKGMPDLCIQGCGITFELVLRGKEEDSETYNEYENGLRNDSELQELIEQSITLIDKADRLLKETKDE